MLKEIFTDNKSIVINSDIDGFLCGMILQKYYDCKVVGFSDSRDTVWLIPEIEDVDAPVYIDLYVARPRVVCIEQHIISFNREHHERILSFGTKINPNLERRRTFIGDMDSDYYHKYPFGTVHYLIYLMAKEGINVVLPDLMAIHQVKAFGDDSKLVSTSAGHVILRADDALNSTLSPYRANALDWWKWFDPDHEFPAIESLRHFIDSCEIQKSAEYKSQIGAFFKCLGCDGSDGAFTSITDEHGSILPKILYYRDVISGIVGMSLNIPEKYVIHKGQYRLEYRYPDSDMSVLSSDELYSYAFIFGPRPRKPNFSYTINLV